MPVGVVVAVNPERQRAAVRREDGVYSVIAYQSHWRMTAGDRVAGKISERGTTTLISADGRSAQVVVEAVCQTLDEALHAMERPGPGQDGH